MLGVGAKLATQPWSVMIPPGLAVSFGLDDFDDGSVVVVVEVVPTGWPGAAVGTVDVVVDPLPPRVPAGGIVVVVTSPGGPTTEAPLGDEG